MDMPHDENGKNRGNMFFVIMGKEKGHKTFIAKGKNAGIPLLDQKG